MAEQNTWGIFDQNNNPVFDIDSLLDLGYDNQNRVSNFPVELGAFMSYNKIATPFKAKVRIAVGGSERIANLLQDLEIVLSSTNLYNVVTPERVYRNVNLERIGYSRAKDHGVNMISVDLELAQVRQVSPQYVSVKRAGSAKKIDTGKSQPEKPPPDLVNVDAKTAFEQGLRHEVGGA